MADSWQRWKTMFLNEAGRLEQVIRRLSTEERDFDGWLKSFLEDLRMLKSVVGSRDHEVELKMVRDPDGNARETLGSILERLGHAEKLVSGAPKDKRSNEEAQEAMKTAQALCGNLPNQ